MNLKTETAAHILSLKKVLFCAKVVINGFRGDSFLRQKHTHSTSVYLHVGYTPAVLEEFLEQLNIFYKNTRDIYSSPKISISGDMWYEDMTVSRRVLKDSIEQWEHQLLDVRQEIPFELWKKLNMQEGQVITGFYTMNDVLLLPKDFIYFEFAPNVNYYKVWNQRRVFLGHVEVAKLIKNIDNVKVAI